MYVLLHPSRFLLQVFNNLPYFSKDIYYACFTCLISSTSLGIVSSNPHWGIWASWACWQFCTSGKVTIQCSLNLIVLHYYHFFEHWFRGEVEKLVSIHPKNMGKKRELLLLAKAETIFQFSLVPLQLGRAVPSMWTASQHHTHAFPCGFLWHHSMYLDFRSHPKSCWGWSEVNVPRGYPYPKTGRSGCICVPASPSCSGKCVFCLVSQRVCSRPDPQLPTAVPHWVTHPLLAPLLSLLRSLLLHPCFLRSLPKSTTTPKSLSPSLLLGKPKRNSLSFLDLALFSFFLCVC